MEWKQKEDTAVYIFDNLIHINVSLELLTTATIQVLAHAWVIKFSLYSKYYHMGGGIKVWPRSKGEEEHILV